MAESILTEVPSAETIGEVNSRLGQLTLDLIAINELVMDDADFRRTQTLLQSMTRACAMDIDRCMVELGGQKTGYIEEYFGRI